MPHFSDTEKAKEARAKASPRGESRLKKLFKEYADAEDVKELFETLKGIALDPESKDRMDAVKTLLAYLIGKPRETVDISMDATVTDKRIPSWFRPMKESHQGHISIINTEATSALQ